MKFLKSLLSGPITIVLLVLGAIIIAFILKLVLGLLGIVMFSGTRWDMSMDFDAESQTQSFMTFICCTCLSTLISAFIAGYVGGLVSRKSYKVFSMWWNGILVSLFAVLSAYLFWESEHWFYSILWCVDMALMVVIALAGVSSGQEDEKAVEEKPKGEDYYSQY